VNLAADLDGSGSLPTWRRVAVTGAGGFVGRHLAARLVTAGAEVVGIDLRPGAVPGVRWVRGDVAEDGAWDEAFAGADLVLHTAAVVAEWGDRDRFVAVNVEGTRRVAAAAAAAGVGRFVHLSSIVVYGDRARPGTLTDEDAPLVPTGAPYTDTKIGAEHAALRVAARTGLPTTIVRPGDIYGVGSIPWIERPLDLLRRRRFTFVDGGRWPLSPVHVDDVVDGVLRAAAGTDRLAVYNLAGPPVPARHFFGYHARHLGVRAPSLPRPVAAGVAHLAVAAASRLGRPPPFAPEALEYVCHPGGYATGRAERELGWTPRVELDEGMGRTLAVYPGGVRVA
jgi:nucleoside-diphosphate-sugar epimerase